MHIRPRRPTTLNTFYDVVFSPQKLLFCTPCALQSRYSHRSGPNAGWEYLSVTALAFTNAFGSQNWLSEGDRSSRNTKSLTPPPPFFFCSFCCIRLVWQQNRFFPFIISLGRSFPAICSHHYNPEIISHVSNLSFAFCCLHFLSLFVLFQRFIFTTKHSDFVEKSKLCWICGVFLKRQILLYLFVLSFPSVKGLGCI